MIQLHESKIQHCILHVVGNKNEDELYQLSDKEIVVDSKNNQTLTNYFLKPFIGLEELWSFIHISDVQMNDMFQYLTTIFEDKSKFITCSRNIAKQLYNSCTHPKVKSGELYVVYLCDCFVDGNRTDAIGLFKSENKDTFIQINAIDGGFSIESLSGININKLDKGCLIFNTHKEDGYVVSVVDNSNRREAKYWVEDFLQVKRKNDSYTQTQNAMAMCKGFISQLPSDIDKADKAAMMNRVVDSLKQESVNIDSVAERAFGPDHSAGFNSFRNEYQETHEVIFDDSFQGKPEAIKRRSTGTMTTIKLDKNFDVNIHGGEQFIERGYDEERGMKYYKFFFNEEK